jgi:hypothetical protein
VIRSLFIPFNAQKHRWTGKRYSVVKTRPAWKARSPAGEQDRTAFLAVLESPPPRTEMS